MTSYNKKEFWDDRYTEHNLMNDFVISYSKISEVAGPYLPSDKSAKILDSGCGTSSLLSDLSKEGFTNLFGYDFSKKAIEIMKKSVEGDDSEHKPSYEVLDLLNIENPEPSFSFIFDLFTLDAIYCGEDFNTDVKKVLENYSKLLMKDGVAFIVSGQEKELKESDYEAMKESFDVEVKTIADKEIEDVGLSLTAWILKKN